MDKATSPKYSNPYPFKDIRQPAPQLIAFAITKMWLRVEKNF